jgi:uncharacterized protein (DUF58 family)
MKLQETKATIATVIGYILLKVIALAWLVLSPSQAGTQNTVEVPVTVWVLAPASNPAAMLQDYVTPYHTCTFDINSAKVFETDRAAYRYKIFMETKGTTDYWGTKPVRK